MTQTQKAPPDPNRPRTLAAAIERIKQLTTGPVVKPITPPVDGNPAQGKPVPIKPRESPKRNPDPGRRGSPGTSQMPAEGPDTPGISNGLSGMAPGISDGLSGMAPKPLADYLENRSDRELELLLGQETCKDRKHQDSRIVQAIYSEIRRRRRKS